MRFLKKIVKALKQSLYFFVAGYFGFWAKLYLKKWKPTIITVTGSSGKTTLLHLFEAQLGSKARYSHKANSAFGIPFHILGLERHSYSFIEWILFAVLAPFRAFRSAYAEKIYVTEADAERPGEGKFTARILRPDMLVWLSLEEAHGINYDALVSKNSVDRLNDLKKAMAHEFGYLLEYTKTCAVLDKDNSYIVGEAGRTGAHIEYVSEKDIKHFNVGHAHVGIESTNGTFSVPHLIPQEAALSVIAVSKIVEKMEQPVDRQFSHFHLPPGRSSVFLGIKNTKLIDSTYNATFDGVRSMINLMRLYPREGQLWLVLGDMIEQGKSEQIEHEALGKMITELQPDRVVFVGPRLQKYTYPVVVEKIQKEHVAAFLMPGEALSYLQQELKGDETILFKGARFLEGIVEKLLNNSADAAQLCRRELMWVKRRKEWGI